MPKCECQIGISGLDVRRRYFSVFFCRRNSVSNTISKLSATMVWPFYQLYPLNFQDITANSKSECALLRLFKKYNLNVSECVCCVAVYFRVSDVLFRRIKCMRNTQTQSKHNRILFSQLFDCNRSIFDYHSMTIADHSALNRLIKQFILSVFLPYRIMTG